MADLDRDPRLLPFYPLLYLAWADGELSEREADLIRQHVEAAGLGPEPLEGWLDPERPPSPAKLLGLLSSVRRLASELDRPDHETLTDLGVGIARAGGHDPDDAERAAVAGLEAALAVDVGEGAAAMLPEERPVAELPEIRPAFDVDGMTVWLDGDKHEIRARVRALIGSPPFESPGEIASSDYRELVLDWCRRLADEGLGALATPEEFGGGGDPGGFVAAFETLALFDISLLTKFGVQFGLFGGSVLQLGTRRHHERYLRTIGSLDLPGCFAMSESGHGSNVADIRTTATFDPATDEFEIHTPRVRARKDWIGNAAAHGRLATVFAQLKTNAEQHGVHAFLVPIRGANGTVAQGVRIEDCGYKLGLNGIDNGRISFDRVRIPRENLLDRFATVDADGAYSSPIASQGKRFFTMLGTLVGGRVAVGSAAVSASQVALATAIRYGARRRQFGAPGEPERILLDYPSHQRRLMPRLARTYALQFAMHDLQRRYADPDEERRPIEADAAGLKAVATWHATDTIQAAREACGGQGYLAGNRFAALKADSDVFTTYEGDNTVLLQLVAKDLLTGFRREFGDVSGLARLFVDRARVAVTERNPIITRRSSEEHLRDPDFHGAILAARAEELVLSLARRVKSRVDDGKDGFEALVDCQIHALAAARAHVESHVLDRIVAAEHGAPSSSLAEMLERLRSLYALRTIETARGWYLEQGYLDAPKSKAIRDLVIRLCAEIRPQAVPLVDAFAIPESCLGEIAR
ncbi:MAG: acyl-CoA dehydrogenase family protein [Gemmatimonadota bacterium]|nr:acyl-CoA dehydrogenase family protein [Gemmatimonadota bacterium]